MIIESFHSPEEKARWKLVRTCDYRDIPGEIESANETTGEYSVIYAGEKKTDSVGHGGLKIVSRAR